MNFNIGGNMKSPDQTSRSTSQPNLRRIGQTRAPARQVTLPTSSEVVPGSEEDLTIILEWLEQEHQEDGEGFWSNRQTLQDFAKCGELYIIRRQGAPVGFQVGRHAPVIISIRKDYRRTGLGSALIEASVERAFHDDINVLEVELISDEALAFACALGFKRFRDPFRPNTRLARYVIERELDLPEDGERIAVTIAFALERGRNPHPPIHVAGVRCSDGSIALERRVVGLFTSDFYGGDLLVGVEVDGVQLYSGEAKSDQARRLGVTRDRQLLSFYLDRIIPSSVNGSSGSG
jgi:GNAT superfamily N-acetyltransferase